MKWYYVLIVACVLAATLSSGCCCCPIDIPFISSDPIVGKWKANLSGDDISLTCNSDKTFTMTSSGITLTGTWEKSEDNVYKLTIKDASSNYFDYDKSDNTLYWEEEDITFRKE